jgi:hypothetical protein
MNSKNVMPHQTGFKIVGLNETFKMMEDLTSKEKQFIIRGIFRKAGNQVVKPALVNANIYKSSKKQPGKNPVLVTLDKNDPLGVKVGISSRFFYYRFTEFGTKQRATQHRARVFTIRKSGKVSKGRIKKTGDKANRGSVSGTERIYPALTGVIPELITWINTNYERETTKRLKALARKKLK